MATARTEVFGSCSPHPHGLKRTATDALENEQRLSKRFDLLNLDNHGNKLYIPVSPAETRRNHRLHSPPPKAARIELPDDDVMLVEDTPHRIFIYDLDKELAEVESDEENPIFLSDIEKHLNKIPRHLLIDDKKLKPTETNQVVLYNVPASLTVPEEQDNVRKAIVEARARIRENQAFNANNFGSGESRVKGSDIISVGDGPALSEGIPACAGLAGAKRLIDEDPDAMDVEDL